MARPLRIEYPGAIYHVVSRGNQRQRIGADDRDRERRLEWLRRAVEEHGWRLHAFVLDPPRAPSRGDVRGESFPRDEAAQWDVDATLQQAAPAKRPPLPRPLQGPRGRGAGLLVGAEPLHPSQPGSHEAGGGSGRLPMEQLPRLCPAEPSSQVGRIPARARGPRSDRPGHAAPGLRALPARVRGRAARTAVGGGPGRAGDRILGLSRAAALELGRGAARPGTKRLAGDGSSPLGRGDGRRGGGGARAGSECLGGGARHDDASRAVAAYVLRRELGYPRGELADALGYGNGRPPPWPSCGSGGASACSKRLAL